MLIKIIKGTYGLHINGSVVGKDVNSQPFEVDDMTAAELIELGVAECVEKKVATGQTPDSDKESGENLVVDENAISGENNDISEAKVVPEYSTDMTDAELRRIADEFGIEIDERATKAAIVAALDEAFDEIPEGNLDIGVGEPVI
ncbi:MAG: hypothetical protein ACI4F5_06485 [Acutalibacteraceae bacterium]